MIFLIFIVTSFRLSKNDTLFNGGERLRSRRAAALGFCVWAFVAACAWARCSALFFYFFNDFLVKNGLYTEGPLFPISATKLLNSIPFLMFLLEFLLFKGECPNRFKFGYLLFYFFCRRKTAFFSLWFVVKTALYWGVFF